MEIRIPRADLPNAVLAHEYGRVRIMEEVACKVRQLRHNVAGNVGVSLGRAEHAKTR